MKKGRPSRHGSDGRTLSLAVALVAIACGVPINLPAGPGGSATRDIDIAITGSSYAPGNVSVRAGAE